MERLKRTFQKKPKQLDYQPVSDDDVSAMECSSLLQDDKDQVPFSWVEYGIFALLGMAMLWAWNMFLAAAPYFELRFQDNVWISQNFQSAILTISTLTNLGAMFLLTNLQEKASYPFRINLALVINVFVFLLLTTSTSAFLDVSAEQYFVFILTMVACASWGAGLIQNGAFAFAASFGRSEYIQAVMAGQGVAGVLPPLAQIFSVLAVPASDASHDPDQEVSGDEGDEAGGSSGSTSALIYFLTAVAVSLFTLVAFVPLVRRHIRVVESRAIAASIGSIDSVELRRRRAVSPLTLLRKLHWLAAAVAICFSASMFFPVFTSKIFSLRYMPRDDGDGATTVPRLFQPAAFIPLAFFVWNLGDLSGRMATVLPFSLRSRPPLLLAVSVARLAWLPMYLLCNIRGRGAAVPSDLFYLVVVQFLFGLTNGWLGSSCMMAGAEWVDDGEREAAGGFMGLCLVAGLSLGSMLSFSVAKI
ncbi:nucleoside transporter family [Sodiomyces alkalinus F11]|uniref:Nucleoside transporter family n=1 Tax=Sodiomyces alkalinus (strain CBS 110278 / VKM F-3762 / F11) TaxID=1314773 RepID=A0A3N2PUZ1_SODAK|nr:nucleoside transporter family [Sodiomyces alkalinus F11]ROT38322.1 nucleoside transporter family [Sodiomyces alkalinus F11]